MPLKTRTLEREFIYDGRRLADPNPQLDIEDVRGHYAGTYPALNNASYEQEVTGNAIKVTFTTAIGRKG
jgi:PRTRC genetic system protein C